MRERIRRNSSRIDWKFVTLYSRSRKGENALLNIEPTAFDYNGSVLQLFELQVIGATPPSAPLDLSFTESMTVTDDDLGLESYVLAARVRDFLSYLKTDPEFRLLARNVRDDLNSDINADIRETFRKKPQEFWYSHNGIVVVCSKASIYGKKIRLTNPSVINGAQTLHALKAVRTPDPKSLVLTRVVVLPPVEDDGSPSDAHNQLLNRIIFRTNQQNKIYRYNLRANDSTQVSLAGAFVKRKVFYERKQGEWNRRRRLLRNQGLRRLTAVQLAQILTACQPAHGPAIAKKSREDLFAEPIYDEIFGRGWEETYMRYRVWRFMSDIYTATGGNQSRKRRHAWLTCVAILHGLVSRSTFAQRLTTDLDALDALDPRSPKCKKISALAKEILRAAWAMWRKENKKDRELSPNNFFKSKTYNEAVIRSLVKRFSRRIDAALRPLVP